jgi:hypothetical protein
MKSKSSKNKRYESDKKPESCPADGSKKVAQIKDGKIVLGGCCISDDDPSWRCINC